MSSEFLTSRNFILSSEKEFEASINAFDKRTLSIIQKIAAVEQAVLAESQEAHPAGMRARRKLLEDIVIHTLNIAERKNSDTLIDIDSYEKPFRGNNPVDLDIEFDEHLTAVNIGRSQAIRDFEELLVPNPITDPIIRGIYFHKYKREVMERRNLDHFICNNDGSAEVYFETALQNMVLRYFYGLGEQVPKRELRLFDLSGFIPPSLQQ